MTCNIGLDVWLRTMMLSRGLAAECKGAVTLNPDKLHLRRTACAAAQDASATTAMQAAMRDPTADPKP